MLFALLITHASDSPIYRSRTQALYNTHFSVPADTQIQPGHLRPLHTINRATNRANENFFSYAGTGVVYMLKANRKHMVFQFPIILPRRIARIPPCSKRVVQLPDKCFFE